MDDAQAEFPPGFIWGTATSAYQIEGAANTDGKGASIWDTFCSLEGNIRHGDTGAVACDHYHRFRADVALMQELGIPHYRLSISWPRVMPAGTGPINPAGLDFYDALIDALLEHSVRPWVTLFHWDYPQTLQDNGGWLHGDSPRWFAQYVQTVVRRLSDRVQNWFTINEPQVFLRYGHLYGMNAPGLKLSLRDRLLAAHHVLLAHGLAVSEIREHATQPPIVGWAPVGVSHMPVSSSITDVAAAYRAMEATPETLWSNTWFNDPVILGQYPERGVREFGAAMPAASPADLQIISTPIDFLGLNIYTGTYVRSTGTERYEETAPVAGAARTAFDWPVYEESLYWGPRFHADRYHLPIYITENGMANIDWVGLDGRVQDPQRTDFLTRYLRQLHRAIQDGIDVRGYFLWSLLDNFEWAEGFGKRFGLVHVDFASQQRTPKDSASWYREVIATNGKTIFS